jgi:6-pyruvoyltetrahydropterin/6-carboxytetrahydropterin synthase
VWGQQLFHIIKRVPEVAVQYLKILALGYIQKVNIEKFFKMCYYNNIIEKEFYMYELSIKSHFDSAHFLRNYKGQCADVHGHRFHYIVKIAGNNVNDETGLLIDFKMVKTKMVDIEERLDHKFLNHVFPFNTINPTAENLAWVIYQWMSEALDIVISEVTVFESEDCSATYRPGQIDV